MLAIYVASQPEHEERPFSSVFIAGDDHWMIPPVLPKSTTQYPLQWSNLDSEGTQTGPVSAQFYADVPEATDPAEDDAQVCGVSFF
jgi:hypothetical protein